MAVSAFPTNLDPRIGLDAASEDFHHLLFNGLLRKDPGGKMIPDLCLRFERLSPTLYRFYLRSNVVFHNGRKLHARDVVYTYESILNETIITTKKAALGTISKIEAVSDRVVDLHLSEPFNGLLVNLNIGIVPAGAASNFSRSPIGTGPFMLRSYEHDREALLESNPNYFDSPPRNRYLRIRMIADATTRALELKKGSVDLVMGPAIIPPDYLPVLQRESHLMVTQTNGNNYAYLGFNMKDNLLKDRRVRQAIGYAIDRDEIIRKIHHGAARRATGLLAPHHWSYEGDVLALNYNPQKAKLLLDEAGYRDPDGDGPAMRFSLVYKTSTHEMRRMLAAIFQNQLARVGIEIKIHAYEFGTFFSDINRGNFQMYMLMWVGESDPDIYRNIFATTGTRNRGKYSDTNVDEWVVRARIADTEEKQRYYYSLIQKKVAQDCPYISLWYESNIAVLRKGLQGFELTPDADVRVLKNVYWRS